MCIQRQGAEVSANAIMLQGADREKLIEEVLDALPANNNNSSGVGIPKEGDDEGLKRAALKELVRI